MLANEVIDGNWTNVDDNRNYVLRRFVGDTRWSLAVLKLMRELFASRFLGIVITLLVAIMALPYLLGRGRWVQDEVESGKRIRLQSWPSSSGFRRTRTR